MSAALPPISFMSFLLIYVFFLLLYDPQRHFHQLVFWPLANVRQHVISFFKFNHTIIILWPLANVRQHVNLLPIHCKYPHCCNSITSQSQQNMHACWVKKKYSSTVWVFWSFIVFPSCSTDRIFYWKIKWTYCKGCICILFTHSIFLSTYYSW